MNHQEMLVGGHFLGGPCDQSVSKIVSRNPFSGSVFGTAAEAGEPEAFQALDAAIEAFPAWSKTTAAERSDALTAIADLLAERESEVVSALVHEVGKPITWAEAEVRRAVITFRLGAEYARSLRREPVDAGPDPRADQYRIEVERVPVGPVLCITPYNWPINLAAHKIAPCLAVGNTLVVKGSERAPHCTYILGRILHDAGLPHGVANVIVADGRTTSKLCADPRFGAISFTGSPHVGWSIKTLHPRQRVTLELGGDAFAVLDSSADLDAAIPKLVASAFGYAGQVCISCQHILCHRSVYEDFRARFVEAASQCSVGDPSLRSTLCGPMIDDAEATRVIRLIEDAVEHGAQLLLGGTRTGNVVFPTIVEAPGAGARILEEEAFGPVVTLRPFDELSDAIGLINQSKFGLQSALFSRDDSAMQEFAAEVQCGGIILNDSPSIRFDAMPYGGMKESGYGREGIVYAVHDMSELKTTVRRVEH